MYFRLLLALLALIVLRSLIVRIGERRAWTAIVLYLATAMVGMWAIHQTIWSLQLVPPSATAKVLRGAIDDLKAQLAVDDGSAILLIDGGSFPARGLDGEKFAAAVQRASGRRIRAVQLTLPAANHFERFRMYEALLDSLSEQELAQVSSREVWLMLEVQAEYDVAPLAQFAKNAFSDRTYWYMSPANALQVLRSLLIVSQGSLAADLKAAGLVGLHALVNASNIGTAGRAVRLGKVPAAPGYAPLRNKDWRGRFPGTSAVARSLRYRGETVDWSRYTWNERRRIPRLRRLLEHHVDKMLFYSMATMKSSQMRYAKEFCLRTPEPCMAPDGNVLRRLNHPSMWFDGGHLSRRGADVYTGWLAQHYAPQIGAGGGR